jgi:molybdopterin converting factor small subunit
VAEIVVRYFAAAADAAGREEEGIALPEGAVTGDLKALLIEQYGDGMARVFRSGSLLVDGRATRDDTVPLGARADVLPPFAGG